VMAKDFHAQYGIHPPFRVLRLVDDENGLVVLIKGTGENQQTHELLFDGPYGYRNFDEGDTHKYRERHGISSSGCFELSSSEFLDWAAKENLHDELPEGVKHYALVSSDDVIEVLAFDPPEVRKADKNGGA